MTSLFKSKKFLRDILPMYKQTFEAKVCWLSALNVFYVVRVIYTDGFGFTEI